MSQQTTHSCDGPPSLASLSIVGFTFAFASKRISLENQLVLDTGGLRLAVSSIRTVYATGDDMLTATVTVSRGTESATVSVEVHPLENGKLISVNLRQPALNLVFAVDKFANGFHTFYRSRGMLKKKLLHL